MIAEPIPKPATAQPTPTVVELVGSLARRGVRLWADDQGQLRFRAKAGALTPDLKSQLVARKAEVLEFLIEARDAERGGGMDVIAPAPRDGELPLSFAQERLWFIDRLEPGSASYNIFDAIRLSGRVSLPPVAAALSEIFTRHEVLRTTFESVGGKPRPVVAAPAPVTPPVVDLGGLTETDREPQAHRLLAAEVERGFDLAAGPLLRVYYLRLAAGEAILHFDMHHVVSDGWSTGILVTELAALHDALVAGRPSPLPPLGIQYADYAAWQRTTLTPEALEGQMAYWREALAELPEALELPFDRPRPAVRSLAGATHRFELSTELSAAVRRTAREARVTPFVVLMASYMTLLGRYSGSGDVVVGTPTANRNRPEIEGLIGFFVNTLVLRGDLSGNPSFRDLLARLEERATAAQQRQDLPFERLVEELAPERDLSKPPLFQTMLVFHNAPAAELEAPGLKLERLELANSATKLDLTLSVTDTEPRMVADVEYSTELLDRTTVARITGHWRRLLEAACAAPGAPLRTLPFLPAAERHQVLHGWNDRADVVGTGAVPGEGPAPVAAEILARAAEAPDRVAVEFEGRALTYGELARRAAALLARLDELGAGPDVPVGIFLDRSPEMIVAALAVLASGGPYVPLDPTYPEQRLAYMLTEPGSKVLVTQSRFRDRLAATGVPTVVVDSPGALAPTGDPAEEERRLRRLARPVDPDAAAYVIYTSGSTGRPKGVVNSHRALAAFLHDYRPTCAPTGEGGDRVLLFLSFAFDASVGGLYPALTGGATLLLHPAPAEMTAREMTRYLAEQQVTLMDVPVNFWNHWVEEMTRDGVTDAAPALRSAVAGGEPLYRDRLASWGDNTAADVRFVGAYGPTETTVAATVDETVGASGVPRGLTRLPIGRPIAGMRVLALDERLQPVPIGATGELYLAGDHVTRGYLHEPAATAARFLPDPWGPAGGRMYRTGDFARALADGRYEFRTRRDEQVKIRGFRIEPAEVEAALGLHPGVGLCAVVPKAVGASGRQLVAYVVAKHPEEGEPLVADLRSFLAERLPSYMVPSIFVYLDRLPRNPASDKVDYQALPDPDPGVARSGDGEPVGPTSATEEVLAGLWAQLLGVDRPGIHDSFFELGGHSLLATQLVSRVSDAFEVELPLKTLFEGPTVAELAQRVDALVGAAQGQSGARATLVPVPHDVPQPVSFSQERMWLFEQLFPGTPTYNTYRAGHVYGPLCHATLDATYDGVIARHESLRTRYLENEDGAARQVVEPHRRERMGVTDLSGLSLEDARGEVLVLALEDARHPIPLETAPLSRARLLRLGPEEHVFLWSIHHIAYDLWSGGILLGEVEHLYLAAAAGCPERLPEPPVGYVDYAVWQRSWLSDEVMERELDYWRDRLAGVFDNPMELPPDRPRPQHETHRGHSIYPTVDRELTDRLWALARRRGVTQFMLLTTALKALLHRVAGHPAPVVGTFISNRNRQELEDVVGYFDNTVVLRTSAAGDPTFDDFLARVRDTALGAYAHQHLPFETLSAAVRPEGGGNRPLFSVDFIFQLNYPGMEREMAGLSVKPYATHSGTAKFDLGIGYREAPAGLMGEMELSKSRGLLPFCSTGDFCSP